MHRQKPTKSQKRFFVKDADKVFLRFFQAVVEDRGRNYEKDEAVEERIARVGRWISDPDAPFGLILGGRPGNGKTTTVRALQLLINLSNLAVPANLDYYGNPAKANEVLGWKAERSLKETLAAAWKWQMNLRERNIM